jgi:F-type H+-transporting ATPase subunit delta
MAEIATVARPYAEALFKVSTSDRAEVGRWLEELALIAADVNLLQFANDPKASDEQVFDLISGLLTRQPDQQAGNFLRTLIENDRLTALPEINAQFQALKNTDAGLSDAVIYSAFAVDLADLAEVGAVLEKRFGRKLNLRVAIDAQLIGGIRVVVGDEVLDTSIKARLEQMKVALAA